MRRASGRLRICPRCFIRPLTKRIISTLTTFLQILRRRFPATSVHLVVASLLGLRFTGALLTRIRSPRFLLDCETLMGLYLVNPNQPLLPSPEHDGHSTL